MNDYELKVFEEVEIWKVKITKRSGLVNRLSKKAQLKMNGLIPEKVHNAVTESIKAMVKATLFGAQITANKKHASGLTLSERDVLARRKADFYKKTAIIEGAGTGAGGFLVGMADFPLLLSIKIKALFEIATIYGYDTNDYSERMFILHVFMLAFSSDETRIQTLKTIENWEHKKDKLVEMDWRKFQQEYRDYIDLAKILQMVPAIGAVVGAYANRNLLKHLGDTAINAYRLRWLEDMNALI
ncbi:MAG: EcsC family protein [Bacillota bacterium]|nr:EcsC family protein [Bacillota bacterium]